MENLDEINLGVKTRAIVLICDIALRIIKLIYHIVLLFFQLLFLFPMIIKQKASDTIRPSFKIDEL
jgi:hypothetical protein